MSSTEACSAYLTMPALAAFARNLSRNALRPPARFVRARFSASTVVLLEGERDSRRAFFAGDGAPTISSSTSESSSEDSSFISLASVALRGQFLAPRVLLEALLDGRRQRFSFRFRFLVRGGLFRGDGLLDGRGAFCRFELGLGLGDLLGKLLLRFVFRLAELGVLGGVGLRRFLCVSCLCVCLLRLQRPLSTPSTRSSSLCLSPRPRQP